MVSRNDCSPDNTFRAHTDSIRAITCHPTQDEVFLSASEDGTIRYFDERQRRRGTTVQDIIQTENEVTGVQYHPTMEHIFATSDGAGRVVLRDSRMAFGPLVNRTDGGVIQRYNTKITKTTFPHLCNPDASSFTFDREGTKLAVTFLNYLPAIYSLSDPNPIAVLSGRNLPDGSPIPPKQRTYKNSCTMKVSTNSPINKD
jgi:WD repeat-containing protein 22